MDSTSSGVALHTREELLAAGQTPEFADLYAKSVRRPPESAYASEYFPSPAHSLGYDTPRSVAPIYAGGFPRARSNLGGRSSPRRVAGNGARAPDDPDEPEPPLGRLSASARSSIKRLIDRVRRERLLSAVSWRLCASCQRDQELEEFSNGSTYCKSCEAERIAERRRRVAA